MLTHVMFNHNQVCWAASMRRTAWRSTPSSGRCSSTSWNRRPTANSASRLQYNWQKIVHKILMHVLLKILPKNQLPKWTFGKIFGRMFFVNWIGTRPSRRSPTSAARPPRSSPPSTGPGPSTPSCPPCATSATRDSRKRSLKNENVIQDH